MHTPVLLKEVLDGLNVKKGLRYIDATYGEGGHSREIIKKGGEVLAIEWDEERSKLEGIKLVRGNFADIETIAKENDFYPVDGILFDLGLSMEQIGKSGRGFSYERYGEPLDMRISKKINITAGEIINSFEQKKLYEIFAGNSEEVNSWPIAKAIHGARLIGKIETVGDLVGVIKKISNDKSCLRRIFQALRIEVNGEFENLKSGLKQSIRLIKKNGVIAVITFHSLEDRIVKNFVKTQGLRFVFKKPIISKSGKAYERSAKLRIITI